jgi:hypothetical protein
MRTRRLALVVVGCLMAATVGPVAGETVSTFARLHDPVVVSVGRLSGASGLRAAGFRLYRVGDGALEPIPFQLDALDDEGLIVPGVAGDAFTLDDDDELVFMAMDVGQRLTDAGFAPGADRVLEIEVHDPAGAARGWVYLAYFTGAPPPPAERRYVWLDPATHEVRSDFYTVRYGDGRNFFTHMQVLPAAGGSGRNMLLRTGMRAKPTFRFLMKTWSFELTEQNQRAELEAVRVGPVRVSRRFRMRIDIGRFFPEMPGGTVQTAHYRSSFVTPSQFEIPGLALKVLDDVEIENLAHFRDELEDVRFYDANHPDGLHVTGSEAAGVANDGDHDWWVASGPDGSFLTSFAVPDEWLSWGVQRGTMVVGGETRVDTASGEPRPTHAVGYTLLNMNRLQRGGAYKLEQATVVLPRRYQPGDESGAMAMLRQPLAVSIMALDPSGVGRVEAHTPSAAAHVGG